VGPLHFQAAHIPLFSAWLFVVVRSGFLPSNSNFVTAPHPHPTSFRTVAQESVIVIFVSSHRTCFTFPHNHQWHRIPSCHLKSDGRAAQKCLSHPLYKGQALHLTDSTSMVRSWSARHNLKVPISVLTVFK
jgi:hypothetical protein